MGNKASQQQPEREPLPEAAAVARTGTGVVDTAAADDDSTTALDSATDVFSEPEKRRLSGAFSNQLLQGWNEFKNKKTALEDPKEKEAHRTADKDESLEAAVGAVSISDPIAVSPAAAVHVAPTAAAVNPAKPEILVVTHYEGEYNEEGQKHGESL